MSGDKDDHSNSMIRRGMVNNVENENESENKNENDNDNDNDNGTNEG